MEPTESVVPEKRHTRAWLKYAVAALCGALLMLAALLLLKKPDLSEKAVDITSLTDMEADYFDVEKQGEGFDFTWD